MVDKTLQREHKINQKCSFYILYCILFTSFKPWQDIAEILQIVVKHQSFNQEIVRFKPKPNWTKIINFNTVFYNFSDVRLFWIVQNTLLTNRVSQEHLHSPVRFSCVRVVRILLFCVMFCRSMFFPFSFGHCIVCPYDLRLFVSTRFFLHNRSGIMLFQIA
jgi:hypothetical protein